MLSSRSINFHKILVDSKVLLEADLGEWRIRSGLECGKACMKNYGCKVFNIRLEFEIIAFMCLLVSRPFRCAREKELPSSSNSVIYEIKVSIFRNVMHFSTYKPCAFIWRLPGRNVPIIVPFLIF
jgi:hypothetical protein